MTQEEVMTKEHPYAVPAGDLVLHHYWMSPYGGLSHFFGIESLSAVGELQL